MSLSHTHIHTAFTVKKMFYLPALLVDFISKQRITLSTNSCLSGKTHLTRMLSWQLREEVGITIKSL